MHLEFMTPDVWNGLVLGVVFIGLAFAVLRLYQDLSRPPHNTPPADSDRHQPESRPESRLESRPSSKPFDPDTGEQ